MAPVGEDGAPFHTVTPVASNPDATVEHLDGDDNALAGASGHNGGQIALSVWNPRS